MHRYGLPVSPVGFSLLVDGLVAAVLAVITVVTGYRRAVREREDGQPLAPAIRGRFVTGIVLMVIAAVLLGPFIYGLLEASD